MTPHSRDCRSKEDKEIHLRIHNDLRLNLPNELLIEVFKICILKPIIIPSPHCETNFPWTLFRVSQKWRSIAQAMPELWSNVLVNYEGVDSTGESLMFANEITEFTHRILLQSENVPLSLKIVSSSI